MHQKHSRALAAIVGSTLMVAALVPAPAAFGATAPTAETGAVWAWGWNLYGELGDGTQQTERPVPAPVAGLEEVSAVSAGYHHSLVLETDGTVWASGYGSCGQQGDGTTTDRKFPRKVPGLTNVIAVSVGDVHSLALTVSGRVYAWGDNGYGQLGDNTVIDRYTPQGVRGLPSITQISSGYDHNLALDADGATWAWGANYYGQLGDGTEVDRDVPQLSPGWTT